MVRARMTELEQTYAALKPEQDYHPPVPEVPPSGAAKRTKTAVPLERLASAQRQPAQGARGLLPCIASSSAGVSVERRCSRTRPSGRSTGPRPRSWRWRRFSKTAFRFGFTGEDVERGTFSHRHAVYHDAVTGAEHIPLERLPQSKAAFEIRNSPLSENAAVGFEFGYNIQERGRLVMWEAQYGDFINGAQVVLDEFITSGRAKWGLAPSLVLLLPHGYEGQGPDHSSAPARAFPQRRGRHQHAHRQLHDRGAVLPSAAAAGAAARHRSAAAGRHDTQEPAAPPAHRVGAA